MPAVGLDELDDEPLELDDGPLSPAPVARSPVTSDPIRSPIPSAAQPTPIPQDDLAGEDDEPLDLDVDSGPPVPAGAINGAASGSTPVARLTALEKPIELDPIELAEHAGFGPPPSSFVDTLRYVLKVRQRSAALRAEAEQLAPALEQARRELDEALVRLGERAQVAGYATSEEILKLLQEVEAASNLAQSAKDALQAERARHQARVADLDKEHEAIRSEMAGPRQREAKLTGQLAEKQEEQRQLDLRIQRIDIEMRNVESRIARLEEPEDQTPEGTEDSLGNIDQLRAKLPGLRAERERLNIERQHLEGPIEEISSELEKAKRVVAEIRRRRVDVAERREQEEVLHTKNLKQASSRTEEASQAAKVKLAEVGRAIRIDRNAPSWASELYPTIDQRSESVHRLRQQSEMAAQAAKSYDQAALKKGYIYLAASGGGLVLIVVLLLVLVSTLT